MDILHSFSIVKCPLCDTQSSFHELWDWGSNYIMACIHHCNIQNIFTVLNVFCVLLILSSFLINPWQPLIFLMSPQFCIFQKVIYLDSYTVQLFGIEFFHLTKFSHVFFMVQSLISLAVHCLYLPLFIYSPPQEQLGCFHVLGIMHQVAIPIHVQVCVCRHSFQFLSNFIV